MMELLTPTWTFGAYAVICVVGWVLVWLIYPETMGLDLEDVGVLLKDGWGVKESMERLKALKASGSQQIR
jgi:SP family myo-inositol transporter-like MFS transporter 13